MVCQHMALLTEPSRLKLLLPLLLLDRKPHRLVLRPLVLKKTIPRKMRWRLLSQKRVLKKMTL